MALYTHMEFQKAIFRHLSFYPTQYPFYTEWSNPDYLETGFVLVYEQPEYYILSVADYIVPQDFSISFEGTQRMLRFGCLYEGETDFQVEGVSSRSNFPTDFLVWEDRARGCQTWRAGRHFKGIEFALFPAYLERLGKIDPRAIDFARPSEQVSLSFLPASVVSTMWRLFDMAGSLTPLVLEGLLLQCVDSFISSVSEENLSASPTAPSIRLGKRTITFSSFDLSAIEQAAELLRKNFCNPPSLSQLSKQIFLNEQKLQAFHFNIWKGGARV